MTLPIIHADECRQLNGRGGSIYVCICQLIKGYKRLRGQLARTLPDVEDAALDGIKNAYEECADLVETFQVAHRDADDPKTAQVLREIQKAILALAKKDGRAKA